uniref:Transposase n=1 Tax=Mesocestoides corti TaxID=53468 RepID=A0A5K3FVK4_MESCO
TLLKPVAPSSDTEFPFCQHVAGRADLRLPLIRTNIYLGMSLHLGLDASASPTWLISKVGDCVHVLSGLFPLSRVSRKSNLARFN